MPPPLFSPGRKASKAWPENLSHSAGLNVSRFIELGYSSSELNITRIPDLMDLRENGHHLLGFIVWTGWPSDSGALQSL